MENQLSERRKSELMLQTAEKFLAVAVAKAALDKLRQLEHYNYYGWVRYRNNIDTNFSDEDNKIVRDICRQLATKIVGKVSEKDNSHEIWIKLCQLLEEQLLQADKNRRQFLASFKNEEWVFVQKLKHLILEG